MTSSGRGATCAYCERRLEATGSRGKLAATRDHVHPKSRGGTYRVWCCRQCNQIKGDMTVTQWRYFRRHNPEWWRRPEYQFGNNVRSRDPRPVEAPQVPSEGRGEILPI